MLGLAGHVPPLPLVPRELDPSNLDSVREPGGLGTGFPALWVWAVLPKVSLLSPASGWRSPPSLPQASRLAGLSCLARAEHVCLSLEPPQDRGSQGRTHMSSGAAWPRGALAWGCGEGWVKLTMRPWVSSSPEIRMQEMVSMGVGNKPFLDIKPSEAAINDRAIDYIMKGRGTCWPRPPPRSP